jgi:hypothetical protein
MRVSTVSKTVLLLIFSLLTNVSFSQEQYHNAANNFSLMLPEGWEVLSADELDIEQRDLIEQTFRRSSPLAVCREVGADLFETPYILIQYGSTEEFSESVIEQLWLTETGRDKVKNSQKKLMSRIKNAEGCLPSSWKGAEEIGTQIDYDKNRHLSFEMIEMYSDGLGELMAITVRFLGNHRVTVLYCFADGENAEDFLELVSDIADSFSYDKGYGFGEGGGTTSVFIRAFIRRSVLYMAITVGGISLLIWILRRWAES